MFKTVLWLIAATFISPVAVGLLEGLTFHFWLNLVLYILGCGIGGMIHAWWLILTRHYEVIRR